MRPLFALPALCCALTLGAVASAREALVLANIQPRESSYTARVLSLICSDAFGRVGMDVLLRQTPPLRASIEAEAGIIDGEVGRAIAYGQFHPGLIRVEEALASVKVVAFARTPGLSVDGWDSLKGKPYRVEYRTGYITFKTRLEQVLPPQQISSVVDAQSGLQRVALGSTDLFIDTEEYGLSQLSRLQSRYGALYRAGLIEDIPVYIYLHRRHAALAPLLANALSKMKADGALGRHIDKALSEENAASAPP
ncbi:hypothetical protein HSX11_12925 [Oxalobacteraceae bacterium]|nr:hypothetical protein [Oxalobacteraceae bacterium]